MATKRDPKLYREMSVPFPDAEASSKAIEAFYEDVYAARKKHKIPDVLVVCCITTTAEDGEEFPSMVVSSIGDPLKPVSMAAYAHGTMAAEHDEMVGRMLKVGKKR